MGLVPYRFFYNKYGNHSASLMDRMEAYGCSKRVVSFVIPSGLSLNCDGSTLYLSVCSIFLAQAYGIPMDFGQQLIVMGVLVATSKGIAAVPSGSLVVPLATASAVGLPAEGVAIIAGIDRVLDMARTACNTPGHVLACIVVSESGKKSFVRKSESSNRTVKHSAGTTNILMIR